MKHVDERQIRHTSIIGTLAGRLALLFLACLVASCSGSSHTPVPTIPVLGNDASLASLSVTGFDLEPSFNSSVTEYAARVPNSADNVTVSAAVSDGSASLTVNGGSDPSVPLVIGENTIRILVTAEDDTTTRIYTIIVTRAASDNADLSRLQLADTRMVPYFDSGISDYLATVEFSTAYTQVEAWTSDTNATITVNGSAVASGLSSDPIALLEGSNTILVRVTAEDGASTQTYTVTVVRPSASVFIGKAYIKGPDLSEADYFGSGVALSGDGSTLAVGSTVSWLDNSCGEGVFARAQPIRVYTRDSGGDWSAQPPVPLSAYDFELSADGSRMALITVKVDGELLILSRENDGQWTAQKLDIDVPQSASLFFLTDVALSGDGATLAVSVQIPDGYEHIGRVVVFSLDSEGEWSQQASIHESGTHLTDIFGEVIALSGDGATLAVGAPDASVYIFTRDSSDTWIKQAQLSASYLYHSEQWSFGQVIALSSDGSTLAVSEYYNSTVYMYTRASDDVWIERQRLIPPRWPWGGYAWDNDDKNASLALSADGSTLAAGPSVFDQNGVGTWVLSAQAHPWTGDPGYFALDASLSADGTILVLGAPGDSTGAIGVNGVDPGIYVCNSGAAYLFER